MITIHTKDMDTISQKSYDNVISGLNLHELTCTCGKCGCLIHHGSYERKIKVPEGEFRLRVNRVKCSVCGCTHALLLSSMIPYSQIVLKVQLDIIHCSEKKSGYTHILLSNLSLDENTMRAVILRYRRRWKQLILAHHISMFSMESLIKYCFSIFQVQFMQGRGMPNILFIIPT